jgi:hypothetical protein
MRAQVGIVADENDCGIGAARFREKQFQKGIAIVGIKGRGRFIGEHQCRPSDQRPCGGNPLLLADAQAPRATILDVLGTEPQGSEQSPRFINQPATAFRCLTPKWRETTRQQDVVEGTQIGEQVELLKDKANMVSPEQIALSGAQLTHALAKHPDVSPLWQQNPAQQLQQSALP